jgi:hypothetical protein
MGDAGAGCAILTEGGHADLMNKAETRAIPAPVATDLDSAQQPGTHCCWDLGGLAVRAGGHKKWFADLGTWS